ncbi:nuclear transport factor 2 family protein [Kribbella pittospori]|uniref:Nuclear transport factor 2 family protein n=1 Tax=Kribbella pittospori TaxID=722689 RepID=A0A4R0JWH1_9ACTN|nr:nuclear transport factor 2 family protein [Kribbella pittospori]TCC51871.1 nuclear transport factor 2 family protein [Kribbella pittospori]
MTSTTLAEQYFAMWNEADADRRAELIAGSWTEDATFVDPSFETNGHDELNKLVGAAQQMFPGLSFVRIGDIDEHHTYLRWTWHLKAEGQDPVAGGTDIVLLAEDGRIQRLIGFHDFAPAH